MLRLFLKRFWNRNSEEEEEEEDKDKEDKEEKSSSNRSRKLGGNLQQPQSHELDSLCGGKTRSDEEMRLVAEKEKKYSDLDSDPRPLLQQSLDNNTRIRVSKGERSKRESLKKYFLKAGIGRGFPFFLPSSIYVNL